MSDDTRRSIPEPAPEVAIEPDEVVMPPFDLSYEQSAYAVPPLPEQPDAGLIGKQVAEVRRRVQAGELDLRDIGKQLIGFWDQDFPAALLDAAIALAARDQRIAELELQLARRRKPKPMLDYPPDYPGGFDGPTGAE